MQADEVRRELDKMKHRLVKHDAERDSMSAVIRAYEDWLRVLTDAGAMQEAISPATARPALTVTTPTASSTAIRTPRRAPKGTMSNREAILQVLKDAGGVALHVNEILVQIERLGVRSDSAQPSNIVNTIARRMADRGYPIKNVGSRQFRWTGSSNNTPETASEQMLTGGSESQPTAEGKSGPTE